MTNFYINDLMNIMEQLADTEEQRASPDPSRWQRFTGWLGKQAGQHFALHTPAVSAPNHEHVEYPVNPGIEKRIEELEERLEAGQADPSVDHTMLRKTRRSLRRAEHYRDTAGEAGRPEGRVTTALVLGETRYPDPSVWRPNNVDGPLMQDPSYLGTIAWRKQLAEKQTASDNS